MRYKDYLRFSWVPVLLALTAVFTSEIRDISFDPELFAACLIISFGHFYLTHFAGAKYFAVHNPDKIVYWKFASWSYLPWIISFWIFFALKSLSEYNLTFAHFDVLIFGLLTSFILFAVLIIKKVKMDLDAVFALLFIIAIVGAITLAFFTWLLITLTGFR